MSSEVTPWLDANLRHSAGDFTLDVELALSARRIGLIGRSGAGKTTLLQCIAGLRRPKRGHIALHDETLFDHAKKIDRPPHQRQLGYVFQDARLFPHRSVESNLRFGERRARGSRGLCTFDELVALLELQPLLRRRPRDLSGGEAQRVALGRALLSGPRALLLDEPLTGLDAHLRGQVMPFLQRVLARFDLPVLFVSHDLREVQRVCDALVVLEGGRVLGQGAPHDVAHAVQSGELLHSLGWTNVLRGEVRAHLPEQGVSEIAVANVTLRVPLLSAHEQSEISLSIDPRDIALATEPLRNTSIQNIVAGTVKRISEHGPRVLVELGVGAPLIAEVSRHAVLALEVHEGGTLYALIKSSAIRVLK